MKKLYNHLLMITVIFGILLLLMPAFGSHTADSQIAMSAYAEDKDISYGHFGDMPWRITSNYTLILGEEGKEYNISRSSFSITFHFPWSGYKIKSVKICGKLNGEDSLYGLFEGQSSMTSIDLEGLDTSQVTDMRNMFSGCSSLTSLDLSDFDTRNVKKMNSMFDGCKALTSLKVNGFRTGSVETMENMFCDCSSLTSLDLSGLDTRKVKNMNSMFDGCKALTSLKVNGFGTGSVETMNKMFSGCSSLTSINVSGWDTSQVEYMRQMFSNCKALKTIDLSHWALSKVYSMEKMFYGCSSITSINLNLYSAVNLGNMSGMFSGCGLLKSLDLDKNDGAITDDLLKGCKSLKKLKLGGKLYPVILPVNMIGNNRVYYPAGAKFDGIDYGYASYSFKASSKLPLKKIKISGIKGSDRGFTVKWKKASKSDQKKFSGYQVQYCPDDYFESETKTVTAKKSRYHQYYTGTKLNKDTTYYLRIRRFKKSGGKTIYAQWSNVRVVKTK